MAHTSTPALSDALMELRVVTAKVRENELRRWRWNGDYAGPKEVRRIVDMERIESRQDLSEIDGEMFYT